MSSVTRKPRPSRAERHEQRRADIGTRLLAALEELLDAGGSYTELSVERLLRESGVARTTFYAYFEDKGDLLLAVGGPVVEDLLVGLDAWAELPPEATADHLAEAIRVFLRSYLPHRVVVAAIAETAAHDPRVAAFLESRIDLLVSRLTEHLRAGRERGLVRDDVDPDAAAVWLAALLERGLHQMLGPGRTDDADRTVDALTGLVWNAVYRGAR